MIPRPGRSWGRGSLAGCRGPDPFARSCGCSYIASRSTERFGAPDLRWYGTIVTLQCGRSESASAIDPAVRSCSSRCQTRVCWMRGISTVTSVSTSPSSAATSSSAARFRRRSGSSWISSETRARPRRRPGRGEVLGAHRVEIEVDDAQLVGSQRPRVLERSSGGEVDVVDEHEHDVPAQDRRGDCLRRVVLELVGLGLVLAVEPHQERDHDRHEHQDHPGAVRELRDGDDHERRGTTAARRWR